ncbi:hypothetical protein IWW55_001180 [Coemansia sp. RSA 2706]|nr:hypothetical protein IWW55_001180 [Coemansia sp. RSA 2706]KAJ2312916.1 hypothetical protein IWW54_001805 [Coemansia sp. RSA 2705]
MSNFARALQVARPDSRSSQYSGRFTAALSAAAKPRDPPRHSASAEEQLEEVEQKITLTLQAIDANFDHCQRTMARDVMPKVERLGRLSSELLQASQPWLQFFMAVAAADDDSGAEPSVDARAAAVPEQVAAQAEITARFPESPRRVHEDTESVDIDAEIATPQLTSRFMTQELGRAEPTPRATKRMAEQLSASIRKRARPMAGGQTGGGKTPVSMMRRLVHAPGSAASAASKNSSLGTSDLMPDTSPPHTTTFTLPKSRQRPRVAGAATGDARLGFGDDDDDDEILDEINSLIKRYDSPQTRRRKAGGHGSESQMSIKSQMSIQSHGSARSHVSAQSHMSAQSHASVHSEGMARLADKYASPGLPTVRVPGTAETRRVQGLVADMEEMLDEAEAAAAPADDEVPPQPASDEDDDDEIPSPPKITSDLERPRVDVAEQPIAAAHSSGPARNARRANSPARRTFGGHALRMAVEDMDDENMTIGHMSPLALRQQQLQLQQRQQLQQQRFSTLAEADEDDPFGPPRAPSSTRSWAQAPLGERSSTFDAASTFDSPFEHHTRDSQLNSAGAVPIDGTTTILPTREMLQCAAQAAEEHADPGSGDEDEGRELVPFDLELFPPPFQAPPASLQLQALHALVGAHPERLWTMDDLEAQAPAELQSAGVLPVLLDLLVRRRVVRQVADNLWTAH